MSASVATLIRTEVTAVHFSESSEGIPRGALSSSAVCTGAPPPAVQPEATVASALEHRARLRAAPRPYRPASAWLYVRAGEPVPHVGPVQVTGDGPVTRYRQRGMDMDRAVHDLL